MSLRRRILVNISSNYLGHFIYIAVGFFVSPFLIHTLGKEKYGAWVVVAGATSFLGLMDIGIRSSLVKFVAQFSAKGEKEKLEQFISTGFYTNIVLGFAAFVIGVCLVPFIGSVIGKELPPELISAARVAFILVAVQISSSLSLSVFHQVLAGYQRFDLTNTARIITILVNTATVVIFVSQGYTLVALGIITLITRSIEHFICWFLVRRHWPDVRIRWQSVSKGIILQIAGYSMWVFIASVVGQVLYMTDTLVIGAMINVAAVTPYSIPTVMIINFRVLVFCMSNVFNPAASDLAAHGEWDKLRHLTLNSNRYLTLFVFPAVAGMAIFGKEFISLWQGPEFVKDSYPVLLILLTHAAVSFPQYAASSVMYGLYKHKWPAMFGTISALANIIISILLAKTYGLNGVAIGTSAPVILVTLCLSIPYFSRVLDIPLGEYIAKSYCRAVLAIIPMAFFGYYIMSKYTPDSWFLLILESIATSCVYGLAAFMVGLKPEERREFLNYLSLRLKRTT